MAESSLSLTYDDVQKEVGYFLGYGRVPAAFNADQSADVDIVIQRGYRQFLNPPILPGEFRTHLWSFLRPMTTLTTNTPYSTGTVTIASGVVTLASGTWPSWAASGELIVSGLGYTVNTRDSASQITLDDTSATAAAGTTYSLQENAYTLPDDFGGIEGPMTFVTGTSGAPDIAMVGESMIRSMRAGADGTLQSKPRMFAVRPLADPSHTGQRFELLFYPAPDASYVLTYRYHALQNKMATGKYPMGGMVHSETILQSVISMCAQRLDNVTDRQKHYTDFIERLKASVAHDRQMIAPEHVGANLDYSDVAFDPRRLSRTDVLVTYAGIAYAAILSAFLGLSLLSTHA